MSENEELDEISEFLDKLGVPNKCYSAEGQISSTEGSCYLIPLVDRIRLAIDSAQQSYLKRYALIMFNSVALQAEISGMNAGNTERECCNSAPKYHDTDFFEAKNRYMALVDKLAQEE